MKRAVLPLLLLLTASAAHARPPKHRVRSKSFAKRSPMATLRHSGQRQIRIRQAKSSKAFSFTMRGDHKQLFDGLMKMKPRGRAAFVVAALAERAQDGKLPRGFQLAPVFKAALASVDPRIRMEVLHATLPRFGVPDKSKSVGADGKHPLKPMMKSRSAKENRRWLVEDVKRREKALIPYVESDPARIKELEHAVDVVTEHRESQRPDDYRLDNSRLTRQIVEQIMGPGTESSVADGHWSETPMGNEFDITVEPNGQNFQYDTK